jgi:cytochrome c oxidase subunit I+III
VTSPPPNAQFAHLPVVRSRHPLWEQDSLAATDAETRRLMEPLESAPTRWRGALVVDALDGSPKAIVHMPRRSPWPFILSVAFVFLFAAALAERMWLVTTGLVLAAVGLGGWFWPLETERRALEEIPTRPDDGRLPLAVGGPSANGWWGTWVFVAVLATALATTIASFFYLAATPTGWPDERPAGLLEAAMAAGGALMAGSSAWTAIQCIRMERPLLQGVSVTLAVVFTALSIWFGVDAWTAGGYRPADSAYDSAVLSVIGFQWVSGAIVLVMLAVAALWAWLRPRDPRGHGVLWNSALVAGFAAVSWLVALGTLWLTPGLW